MSGHIWVSDARAKEVVLGVSAAMNVDVDDQIIAIQLNKSGQSVPSTLCPTKIWEEPPLDGYRIQFKTGVPDLFFVEGYWLVSERAASIMRQFDLGGGALYSVSEGLFYIDQKTRLPGNYYCWIFGNKKQAFLPDETPDKMKFGVGGVRWEMPYNLMDDNIAVSRDALQGSAVWLDDSLFKAVFMSRPLGDALHAAGLCKAFCLYKARVI